MQVGWNLWNLGVNYFALGGTLLVYDGLPTFLSKTYFWDTMDRYKVAFAFLPTSIIDTLEKEDMVPGNYSDKQTIPVSYMNQKCRSCIFPK